VWPADLQQVLKLYVRTGTSSLSCLFAFMQMPDTLTPMLQAVKAACGHGDLAEVAAAIKTNLQTNAATA
jgi:hypothetical protein